MTTPSKTETETETDPKEKEIIADVLRGFLLLENAAPTGSEQVFVSGVAGKSHENNHIANALRNLGQRNAAADMSRRTWTQARQLMKDVHR